MKYGEICTYIQLFLFNRIYYIQMRLRVPVKNSKQLIYSCLEFLFYPLCPHFVRISSKVGDVTLIFAFKHGHSIYFRRRAECSGKRDGK